MHMKDMHMQYHVCKRIQSAVPRCELPLLCVCMIICTHIHIYKCLYIYTNIHIYMNENRYIYIHV